MKLIYLQKISIIYLNKIFFLNILDVGKKIYVKRNDFFMAADSLVLTFFHFPWFVWRFSRFSFESSATADDIVCYLNL